MWGARGVASSELCVWLQPECHLKPFHIGLSDTGGILTPAELSSSEPRWLGPQLRRGSWAARVNSLRLIWHLLLLEESCCPMFYSSCCLNFPYSSIFLLICVKRDKLHGRATIYSLWCLPSLSSKTGLPLQWRGCIKFSVAVNQWGILGVLDGCDYIHLVQNILYVFR